MVGSDRGFVDFKAVKQAVSLVQLLERYGLMKNLKRNGDALTGPCPLHNGHTQGQFKVSVSKNCWNCFGKCKSGGNVLDFVSRKEGVGIREAASLIAEWFNILPASEPREEIQESRKKAAPDSPKPEVGAAGNKPLGFELKYLDPNHRYLVERGLSEETIKTFGLGYCKKGIMAGRIAIPVHNLAGEIVGYAGRWPGDPPEDKPKYKLPDGFRKSLEVFNIHRAATALPEQPLVVVEGIFDCLKIWQAGFFRVVAVMGSLLSDEQSELLIKAIAPKGRLALIFDEDEAGRAGRQHALLRLSGACYIKVIRLPKEGNQPEHLPPQQLLDLLK